MLDVLAAPGPTRATLVPVGAKKAKLVSPHSRLPTSSAVCIPKGVAIIRDPCLPFSYSHDHVTGSGEDTCDAGSGMGKDDFDPLIAEHYEVQQTSDFGLCKHGQGDWRREHVGQLVCKGIGVCG